MARTEVKEHRKFKRLVRMLDVPSISAMGLLEFLWQSAAQACTDYIGDKEDVEAACEWPYEQGRLWPVLKEIGWIDEQEGRFFVHDYWDHCPDYVKKRLDRRKHRPSVQRDCANTDERQPNGVQTADNGSRTAAEREPFGGKRRTNGGSTQQNTTQQDTTEAESVSAKPMPGPLPIQKKSRALVEPALPGFASFWEAWPSHYRRKDRPRCEQVWKSKGLEARAAEIIEKVNAWSESDQWTRNEGQFIPGVLPWLNQEVYDAPAPPAASNNARPSGGDPDAAIANALGAYNPPAAGLAYALSITQGEEDDAF